jgi:hypothetical protein
LRIDGASSSRERKTWGGRKMQMNVISVSKGAQIIDRTNAEDKNG